MCVSQISSGDALAGARAQRGRESHHLEFLVWTTAERKTEEVSQQCVAQTRVRGTTHVSFV